MDDRQQYPSYEYSTLEVAQQNNGGHGYAHGGYPEQAYQTDPRKYSPQPYEGQNLPQVVDPSYPEVAPKPEGTAPNGDYTGYQEHQDAQHPVAPAPAERRIWGLKRRTFFISLALISLVVIGAVVGGAVGGTVGKKNGETKSGSSAGGSSGGGSGSGGGSSSGNTTTANNSPVLTDSRISAINWTDSSNVEYNAVFWQAKTNDLMMSLWDSNSTSWDQVNITDKMGDTSLNITAMPGTPLAAVARGYPWTTSNLKNVAGDFGIALFYLSPGGTVLEVYSENMRGASWQLGDLTTSSSSLKAAAHSQLSAWWSLCEQNCSGTILLIYEDDSQDLNLANSSDWGSTLVMRNIAQDSSMAITACAPDGGLKGPSQNAVRVYYDSSDKLSELIWPAPSGPWYYGSFSASPAPFVPAVRLRPVSAQANSVPGQDLPTGFASTAPQISAAGYSQADAMSAGPVNILVAGAYANGSVFATYWDNTTWHNATTPLMQGKVYTNFSAVSVFEADQLKLFGLTNESEIHSYILDRKNPQSWTYDQAVITG